MPEPVQEKTRGTTTAQARMIRRSMEQIARGRQATEHRQASSSWLQRRLHVGYNRAARMIDRMVPSI